MVIMLSPRRHPCCSLKKGYMIILFLEAFSLGAILLSKKLVLPLSFVIVNFIDHFASPP
jgi:hypothetical protein